MGTGKSLGKKIKRNNKYQKAEIMGRLDLSSNSYSECLFMFRNWIKG